jgi:N utilization substance protein B
MSSRRQAREWALQMIFELDANPNAERPLESVFDEFWNGQLRLREPNDPGGPPDAHAKGFAEALVRGTLANRAAIDAKLTERLRNWTLDRLGSVERAVLRLGSYELLFAPDPAPAPVVINEAVDLAKYFGTSESGRFVNGILDALARRDRADRSRDRAKSEVWTPGAAPATAPDAPAP